MHNKIIGNKLINIKVIEKNYYIFLSLDNCFIF